jgi:uncharacterized damage-inducible protein DinB
MIQIPPTAKIESQPEPWLRGTLTEFPAEQRAVLHALELAREDIAQWCGPLAAEDMHARPYGLASVAFHIHHIVGSLDRLLTYAEEKVLDSEQKRWMVAEMDSPTNRDELLTLFEQGLTAATVRVHAIPMERWLEKRGVGRKQLPTTVAGLLIHCADHTQRHVGQAITTAKVLLALREQPPA